MLRTQIPLRLWLANNSRRALPAKFANARAAKYSHLTESSKKGYEYAYYNTYEQDYPEEPDPRVFACHFYRFSHLTATTTNKTNRRLTYRYISKTTIAGYSIPYEVGITHTHENRALYPKVFRQPKALFSSLLILLLLVLCVRLVDDGVVDVVIGVGVLNPPPHPDFLPRYTTSNSRP